MIQQTIVIFFKSYFVSNFRFRFGICNIRLIKDKNNISSIIPIVNMCKYKIKDNFKWRTPNLNEITPYQI